MAPINRQQTYPAVLPPSKSRKELANWTWVRLGNTRPKINNIEQRHWQRQNGNLDNRTLDRPGDTAESIISGRGPNSFRSEQGETRETLGRFGIKHESMNK